MKKNRDDRVLGLDRPISRRDFLDGIMFTSACSMVSACYPFNAIAQASIPGSDWTGYTGEGDYQGSAGNTADVVHNAHAVRDGQYDNTPPEVEDSGEVYDCVIVGGGFSGLSAALFFHQRTGGKRQCLVLDNARIFGGVAKRNEFIVGGQRLYAPQGSVLFQRPYPNSFLEGVYEAMGLDWAAFQSYQRWQGPEPQIDLPRTGYASGAIKGKPAVGFFFGAKYGHRSGLWITEPWENDLKGTPFPEALRKELMKLMKLSSEERA